MVVMDHELEAVVDRVNLKMAEGWKPIGGIAGQNFIRDWSPTSTEMVHWLWAQAMVKDG